MEFGYDENQRRDPSSKPSTEELSVVTYVHKKLISLVKGHSGKKLQIFFESQDFSTANPMLETVKDERGYTLLHISAYKKFSNDLELILLNKLKE